MHEFLLLISLVIESTKLAWDAIIISGRRCPDAFLAS